MEVISDEKLNTYKRFVKSSFCLCPCFLHVSCCMRQRGGSAASEQQDPDGKVTLNFITQSSALAPADPNDKLINKRLEEKTNVHINWKNFTNDVFVEKEIWP